MLRELDNGSLRLVKDADPSWWCGGEPLKGLPRPDGVKAWWGTPQQGLAALRTAKSPSKNRWVSRIMG
jgi:hypothetical protein